MLLEGWRIDCNVHLNTFSYRRTWANFLASLCLGGWMIDCVVSRAVDPDSLDSLNPDPDPHFKWILIWIRIRIRILVRIWIQSGYSVWWPKTEGKKYSCNLFLLKKLQFTYPSASIKDVQATWRAFSPQKRTSSTSKMKFINFLLRLWVNFALLGPHRIRIQSGSVSTTLDVSADVSHVDEHGPGSSLLYVIEV